MKRWFTKIIALLLSLNLTMSPAVLQAASIEENVEKTMDQERVLELVQEKNQKDQKVEGGITREGKSDVGKEESTTIKKDNMENILVQSLDPEERMAKEKEAQIEREALQNAQQEENIAFIQEEETVDPMREDENAEPQTIEEGQETEEETIPSAEDVKEKDGISAAEDAKEADGVSAAEDAKEADGVSAAEDAKEADGVSAAEQMQETDHISAAEQMQETEKVAGNPQALPNGVVKLEENTIQYNSRYAESKQIPCEALGGIYFLNQRELSFYSIETNQSSVVYTFSTAKTDFCDAYVSGDKLYTLESSYYLDEPFSTITVYNLLDQKVERQIKFDKTTKAIGVDSSGRIYLAGTEDIAAEDAETEEKIHSIYLLSEDGTLLSSTTSKEEIYSFGGFDATNGNFYVEGYENWVYWGYDHDMHALRAGKVTGDTITFNDNTDMLYVCQSYFYERQDQVAFLGEKYLCVDTTFHSGLSVWNSNNYIPDNAKDEEIVFLERDNSESGDFEELASVGVRAVYRAKNDSIIAFKNNHTIAEYDIATQEEVASASTAYPIFSLMEYHSGVLAVEREGNDFYLEYFPWQEASKVQITASANAMKVKETVQLAASTDGTLDESLIWTSSNPKIASVTKNGEVFAWSEGIVTITVTTKRGLSAQVQISVDADPSQNEKYNALLVTEGAKSLNASSNDYDIWYRTVKSYLVSNSDGTITRVEYGLGNNNVTLETYNIDQKKPISRKTLPLELSIFGGFYSGSDYHYLVFGQENDAQSDETEVIRVVKYTKNWERVSALAIKGINTTLPFEAGSLRMTEAGGNLYIHTCHEMYATSDGVHHQANMTFVIKEDDMTIAQSYSDIMNIAQTGYVSHSFNQFIATDGNDIYRVDHGDAGPRAISIVKSKVGGDITDVDYTFAIPLENVSGYNPTGASVGGFELSSENCLIAGNAVDYTKEGVSPYGVRNIFVSVTDLDLANTNVIWMTNYGEESNIIVRTPQFVKIGKDQFLVMWEEEEKNTNKIVVKMQTIDGNGNKTSKLTENEMRLSDCQPIVCSDNLVRWYTGEGTAPTFYAVNPFFLKSNIIHGHQWNGGEIITAPTCTREGICLYRCTVEECEETKEEAVKALGHDFREVSKVEPTCLKEGSVTKQCSRCKEENTQILAATKDITNCTVEFSKPSYTYDAKAKKVGLKLYDGDKEVDKNVYTKVYKDNVKAGTATVEITGKASAGYKGKVIAKFTINKAKQVIKTSADSYQKVSTSSKFNLYATAKKKLTYVSDNKNIVTVDSKGYVTIKGCGEAKITIYAQEGVSYLPAQKVVKVRVVPRQPKISSLKSTAKGKFTVTYTKDTKAGGYEIRYSTSKSFGTSAKNVRASGYSAVTKTISNLKSGKTYYVKVRAYKKVNGVYYYGKYSPVVTVKTK